MDWFLYGTDLRYERVSSLMLPFFISFEHAIISFHDFSISVIFLYAFTTWKVSVFVVIRVSIFPHLDWIRRVHLIRTDFTQRLSLFLCFTCCFRWLKVFSSSRTFSFSFFVWIFFHELLRLLKTDNLSWGSTLAWKRQMNCNVLLTEFTFFKKIVYE